MIENQESTGTARVLHETSKYDELESEYDPETAISVTTKAIQRSFPEITKSNVQGFVKVNRALRSGKVDIAAERLRMENRAEQAATEILQAMEEMTEV